MLAEAEEELVVVVVQVGHQGDRAAMVAIPAHGLVKEKAGAEVTVDPESLLGEDLDRGTRALVLEAASSAALHGAKEALVVQEEGKQAGTHLKVESLEVAVSIHGTKVALALGSLVEEEEDQVQGHGHKDKLVGLGKEDMVVQRLGHRGEEGNHKMHKVDLGREDLQSPKNPGLKVAQGVLKVLEDTEKVQGDQDRGLKVGQGA